MKLEAIYDNADPRLSLPVRGAWIEIEDVPLLHLKRKVGRSPCGERGLKSYFFNRYST